MPWFKVDDGFSTSRKVIQIPRRDRFQAIGLWLMAGNFAAKELTDGHIPAYVLDEMGAPDELVETLIAVGLWDRDEQGEIWFHDWCEYQPSAAEYREKRREVSEKRAEAANKRWSNAKTLQVDADGMQTVCKTDANEMQTVCPEPEPEPSITKVIDISSNAFDEEFNQFWAIYPRKENKQSARRAFKQALKAETLEGILAGALRYRDDPNRDPAFTKHGQTWLNNQCWNDDPLPARNKANAKLANQQSAREAFLSATTPEITTNPDWAEIE